MLLFNKVIIIRDKSYQSFFVEWRFGVCMARVIFSSAQIIWGIRKGNIAKMITFISQLHLYDTDHYDGEIL